MMLEKFVLKSNTHSGIEHLVPEATVELLRVGFWKIKGGNTLKTKHAEAEGEKTVRKSDSSRRASACILVYSAHLPAAEAAQ